MALDSSPDIETPVNPLAMPADKPLQDPVEALKQLVSKADKPVVAASSPDVQAGQPAGSQSAFLDMGDIGGLYKSQAAAPQGADKSASNGQADSSPQSLDLGAPLQAGDKLASQTSDGGNQKQATASDAATEAAPSDATAPKAAQAAPAEVATPKAAQAAPSDATAPHAAHGAAPAEHSAQHAAHKAAPAEHAAASQGKGGDNGRVVAHSQHTVHQGESVHSIARKALGPSASQAEVNRYAAVISVDNQLDDPDKLKPGDKLDIPAHKKDGTITYTNPQNADEQFSVHKNGNFDERNTYDGTSYQATVLDQNGSTQEHHKGPKPEDNYDSTYDAASNNNTVTRTDAGGNTVITDDTGYKKTMDLSGDSHETFSEDRQEKSADYSLLTDTTVKYNHDGSTVTDYGYDKHTEAKDADGTTTTKWADGKVLVQNPDGTGSVHAPDKDGGYKEHAWGPKPKDNYDETYDPKTGTTVRTEGKDTPEEKTTTRWANNTVKVEAKDGKNYQINADGSEHHWGTENFDKPAFDYKNDKQLTKARGDLTKAYTEHLPADKQAGFKTDMDAFEARAKQEHLSPAEMAKTYDQMSRLLNAKKEGAVVTPENRALMAESLMHQIGKPDDTNQGINNTCNVTTVVEQTEAKNPSKIAEMAATTAIKGEWTAPDGKVIKIDRASLQPGATEQSYPPEDPSARTYSTQVLNLVMANDALQRRNPPESYVMRNPEYSGDTGERRLDSHGNEIKYPQNVTDSDNPDENNKWTARPDNSPGLTDHEIAQEGKRLNGSDYHFLAVNAPQGGLDSISSAEELQARLLQFKQQGKMPVTLAVDGNHPPINSGTPKPGVGPHVVTISNYDENKKIAYVSNQWGPADDRPMDVDDLYKNAHGDMASEQ